MKEDNVEYMSFHHSYDWKIKNKKRASDPWNERIKIYSDQIIIVVVIVVVVINHVIEESWGG